MISLIAALSSNRIIGINNSLPWTLPADLHWFKKNTLNKPIIMGRLTFESIGSVLPDRLNIIVSNKRKMLSKTLIWTNSLDEAVKAAGAAKEIMVIGGASIYQQMLMYADRLYLTHIDMQIKGDTYFPDYKLKNWRCIFSEFHNADNENMFNYTFEILDLQS